MRRLTYNVLMDYGRSPTLAPCDTVFSRVRHGARGRVNFGDALLAARSPEIEPIDARWNP